MKVAIIGYGKMGREIERILIERGHTVSLIIDEANAADLNEQNLKEIDVALEFTTPATAYNNIRRCVESATPVVSGTTGWTERLDELKALCEQTGGALFYASNYSLGVNMMFRLNRRLAELMNHHPQYDVTIEEVHHIHKKDAPSGTAITLAEGILDELDRKAGWENPTVVEFDAEGEPIVHSMGEAAPENIAITSVREGETPGIHTVTYDSEDDLLQLTHIIKNRRTLAMGAVIAAEFLCGKRGCYSMDDLLQ